MLSAGFGAEPAPFSSVVITAASVAAAFWFCALLLLSLIHIYRFMRKDRAAYEEIYELIRPVVRHKTVLELAAGTGSVSYTHLIVEKMPLGTEVIPLQSPQ